MDSIVPNTVRTKNAEETIPPRLVSFTANGFTSYGI